MSQVQQVVVTTDQLKEVMLAIAHELPSSQLPPEVVELEVLRRKQYLTTEEVAKLYQLNVHTLNKGRSEGKGPSYIKDGTKVLYSHTAVQKYLEARRQKTNDQP